MIDWFAISQAEAIRQRIAQKEAYRRAREEHEKALNKNPDDNLIDVTPPKDPQEPLALPK